MQAAQGYPEPVLKLRDLLNTYLEPDKVALVLKSYEVGEAAHRGQTRKTGEPYILHPVAVAQILANMRMDHESIAAAILHDTIEDTPLDWEDIENEFGSEVANLVEGVTKLDKIKFRTRIEADVELLAFHAAGLGGQEVAQLVNEDHKAQAQRDREDPVQRVQQPAEVAQQGRQMQREFADQMRAHRVTSSRAQASACDSVCRDGLGSNA